MDSLFIMNHIDLNVLPISMAFRNAHKRSREWMLLEVFKEPTTVNENVDFVERQVNREAPFMTIRCSIREPLTS